MSQNQFTKILGSLVILLAHTTGRDNVCRLFQYGGLFLAQYYRLKNLKEHQILVFKFQRLSNEMRMVRKILRFLRTLQYSRKIIDIVKKLRSKRDTPLLQSLIMISQAFSSLFTLLFYVFDHRVCLAQIGVISQDNLKINFEKSFRFWFLQCFFSIIRDVCQCTEMIVNEEETDEKSEEKFRSILLNIIKNFLDLIIAFSVLKGKPLQKINIGSVGVIASIIRLYQQWK